MIDDETRAALEVHLSVALAVTPAATFRRLAAPHGADSDRKAFAAKLAAGLAGPFDITPRTTREAWPRVPGPSDGRTSWAEPEPRLEPRPEPKP